MGAESQLVAWWPLCSLLVSVLAGGPEGGQVTAHSVFSFPSFWCLPEGDGGGREGLQDGLPGFNPPLRFSLFPAEGNVT